MHLNERTVSFRAALMHFHFPGRGQRCGTACPAATGLPVGADTGVGSGRQPSNLIRCCALSEEQVMEDEPEQDVPLSAMPIR